MKSALTLSLALVWAGPALTGGHDETHRYRLIVADAAAPRVIVVDPGAVKEQAVIETASPARLYLGPDGRHVWAVQGAAGQVQVIDSGLTEEDHGDHSAMVLAAPALVPGAVTGERPVHFNMDARQVAIFWDGSGAATLHDAAVAGESWPDALRSLSTGAPHHGVAVPVGQHVILTVAPEAEGLPDALAVLGPDGAELSRTPCLNLHGEGRAGGFIAFGCEDGVAAFDVSQVPPAGRFVPYPGEAPEGGMIRQLLSPADTLALVGNWGEAGIAIFDPSSQDGDFAFAELPAARVAFALNDAGDIGFALLADGRLVRFSALTGRLLAETPGVTAPYSMERGVVRPMMAVTAGRVALSDPAAGEVVLVDAESLAVTARLGLGGQPQSLLLLAAEADHDH